MELIVNKLSPEERQEFDERNQRIESNAYGIGVELIAIRDKTLFREDHPTFEDFLKVRHGIGQAYGYKMLRSAEAETPEEKRAIEAPAETSAEVSTDESHPAFQTPPPWFEQPSVPLPPPQLPPPLPVPPPQRPAPVMRDKTGYPIPEAHQALFQRGSQISKILENLSTVRGTVRRFMDAEAAGRGDIVFRRTNLSGILANLDQAYAGIKTAIPFAVCPDCQGHNPDACVSCKGMGLISQFHWNDCVSEEAKHIRAMSVASLR